MSVDDELTVDDFDRPEFSLSPEMHLAQAEMAAERGEEYDPKALERKAKEWADRAPHPVRDAEPVEGNEEAFEEWKAGFDLDDGE